MERGKHTTRKKKSKREVAAFSEIIILFLLFSENAKDKHLRLFQYKT